MTRVLSATVLTLILLVGVAVPVSAGDQRPVHGQFSGSGIGVDQRCAGNLTIGFAISGVVAHMGRMTGGGSNCTSFALGTEAVAIWDGIAVLTAADGSTLTLTYEGSQGVPSDGVASYLHSDTVVSGTGRFDGASGQITVEGVIDLTDLTVDGVVSGWISY